jgi:hypothetical protein
MDVQQDVDECEDIKGRVWAVLVRSMVNRRNSYLRNSHQESMNDEMFLFPLDTGDPNQPTTRCTDQEEGAKGRYLDVEL